MLPEEDLLIRPYLVDTAICDTHDSNFSFIDATVYVAAIPALYYPVSPYGPSMREETLPTPKVAPPETSTTVKVQHLR